MIAKKLSKRSFCSVFGVPLGRESGDEISDRNLLHDGISDLLEIEGRVVPNEKCVIENKTFSGILGNVSM